VYAKGAFPPFQNYATVFSVTVYHSLFWVIGFFKKQDIGYQLLIASCLLFVGFFVFLRSVWVIYRAALILQISVLISGCYLFLH
jgi:hypothetical protein